MSAREATPWNLLVREIEPPLWHGPTSLHLMDKPREKRAPAAPPPPAPLGQRTCKDCRLTFPLTREFFYRACSCPGGWRSQCKQCFKKLPGVVRQRKGGA